MRGRLDKIVVAALLFTAIVLVVGRLVAPGSASGAARTSYKLIGGMDLTCSRHYNRDQSLRSARKTASGVALQIGASDDRHAQRSML